MPVVMVIAVVVVFAVVVLVARGRGGELSAERGDFVPLDLGPVSATDIALMRPPTGLWGYNVQATDEAMDLIAESIKERDVRIVALEQLVTDLSRDQDPALPLGSPYSGARHRRAATDPDWTQSAGAQAPAAEVPVAEPLRTPPTWAQATRTEPSLAQPPWVQPPWADPAYAGSSPPEAEAPPAEPAGEEEHPGTEPEEETPAAPPFSPAPTEPEGPPLERSHG